MAKYQGRTVSLNRPFRTPGQSKKFAVYVRSKSTGSVLGGKDLKYNGQV